MFSGIAEKSWFGSSKLPINPQSTSIPHNASRSLFMLKRRLKRIARAAMIWLLMAMFAMPTSLVRICPCTSVSGESQCECCALVNENAMTQQVNCCHDSHPSRSCETVAERECGIDLLVCHCTGHCPCQCDERNGHATIDSNRTVPEQTAERAIAVVTRLLHSPQLQIRCSRISDSPILHATTAQQRCATLSRFLI